MVRGDPDAVTAWLDRVEVALGTHPDGPVLIVHLRERFDPLRRECLLSTARARLAAARLEIALLSAARDIANREGAPALGLAFRIESQHYRAKASARDATREIESLESGRGRTIEDL